jgi:hypothetical protein
MRLASRPRSPIVLWDPGIHTLAGDVNHGRSGRRQLELRRHARATGSLEPSASTALATPVL